MADSSGGTGLARRRTLGTFRTAHVEFVGLAGYVVEPVALAGRWLDSASRYALSAERSDSTTNLCNQALVAESSADVSVLEALNGLTT